MGILPKTVGWHEYRGHCERASEKEFLSEMCQSSSGQVTEDASEKMLVKKKKKKTLKWGCGGRCKSKSICVELLEFCKRQKMQDFAQKYESTAEVSLAALPCSVYRDITNNSPRSSLVMVWAGGTFHPVIAPFSFFLRPSVIDALFGEINCCVVNGLDRTSGPGGRGSRGGRPQCGQCRLDCGQRQQGSA